MHELLDARIVEMHRIHQFDQVAAMLLVGALGRLGDLLAALLRRQQLVLRAL